MSAQQPPIPEVSAKENRLLPDAEFVIIGGGAVGCGMAHALARDGHSDVLLIEQADAVGTVTTSQGAGLCGQVRDTVERTRLAMHSVAVFRSLQEGRVKPDWHEVGSLRIALSATRAAEFERLHAVAKEAGLETHLLHLSDAAALWPLLDFSGVESVLWCPSDGFMTPAAVTASYRDHAELLGVRFATGVRVEGIRLEQGRVTGVHTSKGTVGCRYVINAAGAHAYHVAKMAGLELPVFPVRHEYFVTMPLPGLRPELPCLRIPELTLYGRVRDGGLLLGGWEPKALGLDPRTFREDEPAPGVEVDAEVLAQFSRAFGLLFPQVKELQQSWIGKGWPTFTPDGRFIIGESKRVPGLVMACGCNAHGISGSGGMGRLLLEAIFDFNPGDYVRSLSPDRFDMERRDWAVDEKAARFVYETYYGV